MRMNLYLRNISKGYFCVSKIISCSSCSYISSKVPACQFATKSPKTLKEEVFPQNPLKDVFSASKQPENGVIYDKKPFKMRCVPGKDYFWCLCGRSKTQPLCDATHRSPYLRIKLRPVKFQVTEEKDYWLCNCKQTSNRPFCDGTHKREDIQAAVK
ncbi:CDGSH iron-sulfur domain-containing protein 3, mitochondrial isoform X2 [Bacillus rossius redtenbacheri]|uniref:CDGSH iron-sulfur domain-containing protein 3, mitochondrial isoform X2 n=1 Tax=Bacillus rossius redtenbacheri TaxID=93214 RepID=UPI002FDD3DEE